MEQKFPETFVCRLGNFVHAEVLFVQEPAKENYIHKIVERHKTEQCSERQWHLVCLIAEKMGVDVPKSRAKNEVFRFFARHKRQFDKAFPNK